MFFQGNHYDLYVISNAGAFDPNKTAPANARAEVCASGDTGLHFTLQMDYFCPKAYSPTANTTSQSPFTQPSVTYL